MISKHSPQSLQGTKGHKELLDNTLLNNNKIAGQLELYLIIILH